LRIFGIQDVSEGMVAIEPIERFVLEKDDVRDRIRAIIEQGKDHHMDHEVAPADGQPNSIVHLVVEVKRDYDGRPIRLLGVIQDITQDRTRDERLRLVNDELLAIKECDSAVVRASEEQSLLHTSAL
jgi:PAS domain-containing protein